MSDKRQSSFRRFRSRRPRENVEECRCSDHCRCCDTQTTEEVYTVTLENAHPGSKVGVGDNFKIYKTESVNINPKEKMVVQLEQEASIFFVKELLKLIEPTNDERSDKDILPQSESISKNQEVKVEDLSIFDLMSKISSFGQSKRGRGETPAGQSKRGETPVGQSKRGETPVGQSKSYEIEVDGETAQTAKNEEQSIQIEQIFNDDDSNENKNQTSNENSCITYQVRRTVRSKVPKVRRKKINGVLLALCGAFCTLPVAIVIIWFIFYWTGFVKASEQETVSSKPD